MKIYPVKILTFAAAMAVAIVAAIALFRGDPKPTEEQHRESKSKLIKSQPPKSPASPKPKAVVTDKVVHTPLYPNMNETDRKLAMSIQAALDSEDLDEIKSLFDRIRKSKNAELRRLMVDALAWFDTKAMLQIAMFLDDEDKEVRDLAISAWEKIINTLEDEKIKASLILESLQTIQDEDAADRIASELNSLDQKLAVETMVRLLNGTLTVSIPVRNKIKETYEFITGEEYESGSRARQWLDENYISE